MMQFFRSILLRIRGNSVESPLISRTVVRTEIINKLSPNLQSSGFQKFHGGRSLRYCEKWIDVFEIQFIRAGKIPANSPSFHVGRYLKFVPEDAISGGAPKLHGEIVPTVERCHFRKTFFRSPLGEEGSEENVWFIGDSQERLVFCIKKIEEALHQEIIPWFQRLDNLNMLLDLVDHGKPDIEGKLADPVMRGTWGFGNYFSKYVVAGFIAIELGFKELAQSRFKVVLIDGGVVGKDGRVFPLHRDTIEKLRAAIGS